MTDIYTTTTRLFVAFFLGGVIGLERERKGRSAGLRTHILVCMGSALIMLTSIYIFDTYKGQASVDPGRIAAGVVTGIGFIGAGTIMRGPRGVHGLTTGASLWVSSAIGLACGCGYLFGAAFTTGIAFLTLYFLKAFENILEKE